MVRCTTFALGCVATVLSELREKLVLEIVCEGIVNWFCQNSEEDLAEEALMEYACGKQTQNEG